MPQRFLFVTLALASLVAAALLGGAPEGRGQDKPAARKAHGLERRVPWTTSRVRGSPEPPSPYRTEPAFPKLKFDEPVDISRAPGSSRLFVVERYGRILSFPNDPSTAKADLLLDLNQVHNRAAPRTLATYGFAAHPQFAKNGFVYVTCITDNDKELPRGTRVSRFRVLPGDPPRCDPKSEQVIIEWPSGGHNGGCLMFGPDGYLYIATGDSSGIADQYLTGQNLGVLPGKILRIDVDHPDPGKAYGIPRDNPFASRKGARPEMWAYGLRQPWKMSFDRATGDLWAGNVGQDLWEQIYRIERGGNYGWSVMEGSHPFRPERPRGPTPVLMPVVEHDHANFRSITGGFVYHGKRLPELTGAYIYGDYDSGRIWTFRYDRKTKRVSDHRELVKSGLRLVGFGEDAEGELYLLDHMGGRISRLAPNPVKGTAAAFPRKLSETGLFASTKEHRPAPGVLPYSVIAPQWTDGATKERFLALPGTSRIEFETVLYPFGAPGSSPGWKFPDGAVVAETFFLEMEPGNPASRRRIETRILHQERLTGTEEVGDQYWRGYSFIWDDDQADATLLEDPHGRDRTFTLRDPKALGGKRQQTWHFPARTECTVCHNIAAKFLVGVQTMQLNRDHDYGGTLANQLRTFEHIGLFTKPLPTPPAEMPRLVDYRDAAQPLHPRGRAYLHANCAHCHRKWGGGNAEFQLLATLDVANLGIVNVRPAHGAFNTADARIVAPGDPYRSVLFYRMSTQGPGHMPRTGSNVVDAAGVRLIHDWIKQLPGTGLVTDAATQADARLATAVKRLRAAKGASADAMKRLTEPLLASPDAALRLTHALGDVAFPAPARDAVLARATQAGAAEVRDLFERFLPEERRVKRLGDVIRPEQILALKGDAARGRRLFLEGQGVQCRTCHRVGGQGIELGPDLDGIGKKYSRAEILDHILNPSKVIEEKYVAYLVETKGGQVHTGLLVSRDATRVILKDATNKRIEVPAAEVARVVPQGQSLMPELQLRDLSAEQVADLTAFLSTLR